MLSLILFRFGWGKPVPVNPANFRKLRRDSILVGLAGVTANLVLALAFGGLIWLLIFFLPGLFLSRPGVLLGRMLLQVVIINLVLMLFNLLPIPPLDGFGVLSDILNVRGRPWQRFLTEYGFVILLLSLVLGLPGKFLSGTLMGAVHGIMAGLYGITNWWVLL